MRSDHSDLGGDQFSFATVSRLAPTIDHRQAEPQQWRRDAEFSDQMSHLKIGWVGGGLTEGKSELVMLYI